MLGASICIAVDIAISSELVYIEGGREEGSAYEYTIVCKQKQPSLKLEPSERPQTQVAEAW